MLVLLWTVAYATQTCQASLRARSAYFNLFFSRYSGSLCYPHRIAIKTYSCGTNVPWHFLFLSLWECIFPLISMWVHCGLHKHLVTYRSYLRPISPTDVSCHPNPVHLSSITAVSYFLVTNQLSFCLLFKVFLGMVYIFHLNLSST